MNKIYLKIIFIKDDNLFYFFFLDSKNCNLTLVQLCNI